MLEIDVAPADRPADEFRSEVRAFLREETASGRLIPRPNAWVRADPAFSRRCGERGYIGMTWPKRYGGRERPESERFAMTEEMLAAGAPVGFHWAADRQTGPQLLRLGSEALKARILPRIAAGECCFAIGMSEPDAGSDLAAVRTRAKAVAGGWQVEGRKVWTTNAHFADHAIVLVRTTPVGDRADRRSGLTQMVVDLRAGGVEIRPIHTLGGEREFNEVIFDGALVPQDAVLGDIGAGWGGVTSELALERSAPDRFLSLIPLIAQMFGEAAADPCARTQAELGRIVASLDILRTMSSAVAHAARAGRDANTQAALVKDIGTTFEQEIPDLVRRLTGVLPSTTRGAGPLAEMLATGILESPSFSLRGGTREVLRGIVARGLGLR